MKINNPILPKFPILIKDEDERIRISKILHQRGYIWASGYIISEYESPRGFPYYLENRIRKEINTTWL